MQVIEILSSIVFLFIEGYADAQNTVQFYGDTQVGTLGNSVDRTGVGRSSTNMNDVYGSSENKEGVLVLLA